VARRPVGERLGEPETLAQLAEVVDVVREQQRHEVRNRHLAAHRVSAGTREVGSVAALEQLEVVAPAGGEALQHRFHGARNAVGAGRRRGRLKRRQERPVGPQDEAQLGRVRQLGLGHVGQHFQRGPLARDRPLPPAPGFGARGELGEPFRGLGQGLELQQALQEIGHRRAGIVPAGRDAGWTSPRHRVHFRGGSLP